MRYAALGLMFGFFIIRAPILLRVPERDLNKYHKPSITIRIPERKIY